MVFIYSVVRFWSNVPVSKNINVHQNKLHQIKPNIFLQCIFHTKSLTIWVKRRKCTFQQQKDSLCHGRDRTEPVSACECLKSVLRVGVDKDHRTSNWVLILYQTCSTWIELLSKIFEHIKHSYIEPILEDPIFM